MSVSRLLARARGRYQRECARLFFRRPFRINGRTPFVSFTFDDFPRSSLHCGGAILKEFGALGTYYVSMGLMGAHVATGTMFVREDLDFLLEEGHELGCHTFSHCHAWHTDPATFEQSIIENRTALGKLVPHRSFRSFSYPISVPRPRIKEVVQKYFDCSRGAGQRCNAGLVDFNCLSACFIEQCGGNLEFIRTLVEENARVGGWLIFATHDIANNPTPFGCTPDFFKRIVQISANSGARILPVAGAWDELHARVA